jgi:1-acyl-sn-glycerol-3-phosphate acyltransferase
LFWPLCSDGHFGYPSISFLCCNPVARASFASWKICRGHRPDHFGNQTGYIRARNRGQEKILGLHGQSFEFSGWASFLVIPQSVRVILKKEIFRIPIIGWAMRFVGFVPVDRKGVKSGRLSIERATRLIKKKHYSYLIFPEGTRSLDGQMQPFRRGAFFLAVNSQVPIVPITLEGSFELMPKGSSSAKKGTVRVVFHEAVPVQGCGEEDIPQLIEKVRSLIQSGFQKEAGT